MRLLTSKKNIKTILNKYLLPQIGLSGLILQGLVKVHDCHMKVYLLYLNS